jgi:hypothetical protein
MSAWMVSTAHIDAMLTAGIDAGEAYRPRWETDADENQVPGESLRGGYRTLDYLNADHVGAMLLAENRRSVNYRYTEDEIEELYTFKRLGGSTVTPVDVLKSIECFEYQACEHPGWSASEARRFCEALRHTMIGRLPGYSDAPWGVERDTFAKRNAEKRAAALVKIEATRATLARKRTTR